MTKHFKSKSIDSISIEQGGIREDLVYSVLIRVKNQQISLFEATFSSFFVKWAINRFEYCEMTRDCWQEEVQVAPSIVDHQSFIHLLISNC